MMRKGAGTVYCIVARSELSDVYAVAFEGMEMETKDGNTKLCGWALARAHARSGDRVQIAAYLGKSERFDGAVADFAEAYADQVERDHAALCAAVKSGRVPGDAGV